MSSSKSRRKVTVESTTKSSSESSAEKRKPSVFARLGPGAPRRSYEDTESLEKCRNWMKTGQCIYGSKCRFQHPPRRSSREDSPSSHSHRRSRKRRDRDSEGSAEEDPGEMEDVDKERRDRKSRSKKEKEGKVKSAIVVTKTNLANSENADSDLPLEHDKEELDDFDATLKLMAKRQLIQKQLSMLEAEEVNKEPADGSTVAKSVTSEVLDRDPATATGPSWSGKWDQPKKSSAALPLSSEDSPNKRKKEKKKKKKTKGPRTPSPDEERREKRFTEREATAQVDVIPSRKKPKHSATDQSRKSRSSGAMSRSPSKSSSGSRSPPPRQTHSSGHRRKGTDDRSASRREKYEPATDVPAKLPPSLEKPKSGRKRQMSPPEPAVESRPEKRHRRFLETPRDEYVTKSKRTPPPRDEPSREQVTSQQRHLQGEPVSSKSRTAVSPPQEKTRWHQSSRRNKTPTKQVKKTRKHYVEEEDDDEDDSSSDDDDDSSSSGSSSSSSSDSSSSSSSDDSADSEEEEVIVSKSRRHVKSRKSYAVTPDSRVVKKKHSTVTKERYSPVDDSRRPKQRPRGGASEHRSKVRRPSPPLLPPLEERQRHWDREHTAPSIDEGRSRGRKHGARSRRAASPDPVDSIPRSRQKSPSSPYDHQRERQHGRDDFDRHYPEKTRDRVEKWDPVDRRTDSPIPRSRGDNRDRYARPPEFERRPSPLPELPRRPLSPQEFGKMPKSRHSLSPGDRMPRYKDDRGRPIRERDRDRLPREESPPHLPLPHQPVDRYGKRYRAMYDDRDNFRPPLLATPKDRYRYDPDQGALPPPLPPQHPPPEMLDRYGREPYLLPLPPGGRDLVMDRRDDPMGRRDFPGYHDDGRGARGRGSPDLHPFPPPGFPVDRMLDPPLDPMYGDMKERDRSMLGRVRERSPLMDKRGDKYRRDDLLPRGGDLPPGKGRPSRRQQWEERPDTRDRQRGLEPTDSRDMALKKRMSEVEGRGSPGRRRSDLSPVESRNSGAGGRGIDWEHRREDWDRGRDRGGRRRRGKREDDREPGPMGGGREKWAGERMEGDDATREREREREKERDWERNKMPKPPIEGPPSRGHTPENRGLREGSTSSSKHQPRSTSREALPSGDTKKKRPKLEADAEWEKGDKSHRRRHGSPPPRGAARTGTGGGADDVRDDWLEDEKPPDGTTQNQKDKKDIPAGEVPVPRPTEDSVRHSPSRSSLGSRHSHPSHDRLHGNERHHGDYDSDIDGGRARVPPPRERGERGRQDWEHDVDRPHPEGGMAAGERSRRGHSRDRPGREERGREDWDRDGGHWQRGRHRDRHDRPESPSRDTDRPPGGELTHQSVDVEATQLTLSGGYENISSGDDIDDIIGDLNDDDQDEQTGRKSGAVDTLCIDWSGLVQQQPIRAAPHSSSALKRFQPASVFSRLGVSKAFAGPELVEKVKHICSSQLDTGNDTSDVTDAKDVTDEKDITGTKEATVKDEKEIHDQVETTASETTTANPDVNGVKKENENKQVKQSFELLHDIAAFHASSVIKKRERSNLLWSVGPHRRALCARRDLEIRRQLCKLGKDSEGLGMFTLSQGVDQDLYRLSLQLFRQARSGGVTAAVTKLKPIVDEAKMVAT